MSASGARTEAAQAAPRTATGRVQLSDQGEQGAQPARRTPLFDRHLAADGKMVDFAGFRLPVRYAGVVEEHHAVRQRAGLFDVSHMGEVVVRGPGAQELLQLLTPNDVSRLRPGRAQYNALLTESGNFIDDLLIYCRGADDYLVVVNAAHTERDLDWIRSNARSRRDVEVIDRSEEIALLALQGPRSVEILQPLTALDLEPLRYYSFADGEVSGQRAMISRTGYTGEDGFELYLEPGDAAAVWDRLLDSGAERGLLPAGLGARDTLRLEAGMLLSGQDIDDRISPLEAGLGWIVKLKKGDFIGSEALQRQRTVGLRQRLVGFELEGRGIARHGHAVEVSGAASESGEELDLRGSVTSGSWSPTLGRAIGLARFVATDAIAELVPTTALETEVRGRRITGQVVATPFYRRARA